MVTKQYQGTRINFPLYKSNHSALIPTAHKICLVVCAEAIYSNTPLPKDWVKSFTLQEQFKVKPTWYLEGSWTPLHCTTEANIISVVEQLLHKSDELIRTSFHIQEQCFKCTCSGGNPI
jgi:hypothetical protein